MTTIDGKAKHEGVAIAVVAKVDSVNGINGVDTAILQEGIRALRKGLAKADYPEVVVACDNVVMGISIKIPGINTIGIAAQTEMDVPGLEVDLPCVIGLPGLLENVGQGSLMIIDGNKGQVHIDPEPHVLIQYQHLEEDMRSRSKVFIASEHIPARTQSGETVNVYAYIKNEGEVEQALDEGADGLLVDVRGWEADAAEFYRAILRAAPGKPIIFVVGSLCEEIVKAAAGYAAPGQITIAFPSESFEDLHSEYAAVLESGPDSIDLNLGCLVSASESCSGDYDRCLVDISSLADIEPDDLVLKIAGWIGERDPETAVFILGMQSKCERLIAAGARSIAVVPEKVGSTKYEIRSIGGE